MKHILFVIPSLKTGGTNSSLVNFYNYLKDKYDVSVFAMSSKKEADFDFDEALLPCFRGLTLFETSLKNARGINKVVPFVVKSTIKVCGKFGFDLRAKVYGHYVAMLNHTRNYDIVIGFQEGTATKFASLFNTYKKIAWVHCEYTKYLGNNKSELDTYKSFDKIICVSNYTSQVFHSSYPSISSKVDYIYNPLDIERIIELSKLPIDDPRYDTSSFTLVSAGRLAPIKQYHLIPQIAYELKQLGAKFCWYLLGPVVAKSYYEEILQNIGHYKVEDCVKLLGNKTNPYPYINTCDAFVCTSESEACPMVFCEAFALGKPVVTTLFGSANEFVRYGFNGFSASIDEVAKNIYTLYSDEKVREQIANNIKSYEPFNIQVYAKLNQLLKD